MSTVELVSLPEAARVLGCGRERVRRLVRAGRLDAVKGDGGRWWIDRAGVEVVQRGRRRWPFAPVEALARVEVAGGLDHDQGPTREVARLFGVHRRQLYRWRDVGVDEWQADELAHPARVAPRRGLRVVES